MGRSRRWLAISTAAMVLALAGIVTQGVGFGLEFTGGRLLEYRTEQAVDVEVLRGELLDLGLDGAVVQTSADDRVSLRTSGLTDAQRDAVITAIEATGGETEVIRDEFIGPTLGAGAAPERAHRPGHRAGRPTAVPRYPVPMERCIDPVSEVSPRWYPPSHGHR